MKTQKLIIIAAIVCLMVGASGPAQALSQEAREIIRDFCEVIKDDAEETGDKLTDADESLNRCVDDFRDCRDGGRIGDGDPLVECLSDGLGCSGRATGERVEACLEYQEEFSKAYERALREARFGDVEDEVQEFFSTRTRARRRCLAPTVQVARTCVETTE
jgi:hypothetical protein